ncbi:MAG: hypothetical protein WCY16_09955 [Weeksellaceae bacterium]
MGEITSALFTDICASTTTLTAAQVNLIVAAPQAIFHGFSQGFITGICGGDLGQSFVSGMVSSVVSSVNMSIGLSGTAGDISTMLFDSVSGGISSKLSGGNFWEGAAIGLTVSALNHVTHRMTVRSIVNARIDEQFEGTGINPIQFKGR